MLVDAMESHLRGYSSRPLRRRLFTLVVCWLAVLGPPNTAAAIRVAFLAPDAPDSHPFWQRTIAAMRAAADDLDVDLEVAHSRSNTYSNRKDGMAVLDSEPKPDYFLTGYWPGSTEFLLDYADERGVKTFFFNSGADAQNRDKVGQPRGKYPDWLGQMTPDDRHAGYDLAKILVQRAGKTRSGEGAVHLIGLGGNGNTNVDAARQSGLKRLIDATPGAVLDRFIFAEWSESVAYEAVLDALQPRSPVSVIWSAGDSMAAGAVRAARRTGRTPGQDILIGSINWTPRAVQQVADGDFEVTFGGHFLEGAWSLILLHDYHHGHDFVDDLGVEIHTRLQPLAADNGQQYLNRITDFDWNRVDFRQFSKVHNPTLNRYQWPLNEVLDLLDTSVE